MSCLRGRNVWQRIFVSGMPDCIMNEVEVKLSEKEWSVYDELRQEMVVSLEDEEIDAANAAAISGKLLQMANGAIYNEEKSVFHDITSAVKYRNI